MLFFKKKWNWFQNNVGQSKLIELFSKYFSNRVDRWFTGELLLVSYRPKQDSSDWIFYLSYGCASFAQARCCYLQSGILTDLTLRTSLKVAIYSKAVIGEVPWLFQVKESNWYLGKCQCETNWLSSSNDYRICFLKYFLKEDWF